MTLSRSLDSLGALLEERGLADVLKSLASIVDVDDSITLPPVVRAQVCEQLERLASLVGVQ